MGLEGRVALITGGGRGIGRGIAECLARDGADIAVNFRRDEASAVENAVAFLVSDQGRQITHELLYVDGGGFPTPPKR